MLRVCSCAACLFLLLPPVGERLRCQYFLTRLTLMEAPETAQPPLRAACLPSAAPHRHQAGKRRRRLSALLLKRDTSRSLTLPMLTKGWHAPSVCGAKPQAASLEAAGARDPERCVLRGGDTSCPGTSSLGTRGAEALPPGGSAGAGGRLHGGEWRPKGRDTPVRCSSP